MTPYAIDPQVNVLFERFTDPNRSALDLLLYAAGIHEYLDQVMPGLAKAAREEEGHTWADVGEVLRITRQAAYQRLGKGPFEYLDGRGGYKLVDPDSTAYLESLRLARAEIAAEPGREGDVRLIDDYLADAESGHATVGIKYVPVEVEVEVEVKTPAKKPAKKRRP